MSCSLRTATRTHPHHNGTSRPTIIFIGRNLGLLSDKLCRDRVDAPGDRTVLSSTSSPMIKEQTQSKEERPSVADDDISQAPAPQLFHFLIIQKRVIIFIITFAATFLPFALVHLLPSIQTLISRFARINRDNQPYHKLLHDSVRNGAGCSE